MKLVYVENRLPEALVLRFTDNVEERDIDPVRQRISEYILELGYPDTPETRRVIGNSYEIEPDEKTMRIAVKPGFEEWFDYVTIRYNNALASNRSGIDHRIRSKD